MANRKEKSGSSDRLYFLGFQNHYAYEKQENVIQIQDKKQYMATQVLLGDKNLKAVIIIMLGKYALF